MSIPKSFFSQIINKRFRSCGFSNYRIDKDSLIVQQNKEQWFFHFRVSPWETSSESRGSCG